MDPAVRGFLGSVYQIYCKLLYTHDRSGGGTPPQRDRKARRGSAMQLGAGPQPRGHIRSALNWASSHGRILAIEV